MLEQWVPLVSLVEVPEHFSMLVCNLLWEIKINVLYCATWGHILNMNSFSVAFGYDCPNYVFFIPDIPRDSSIRQRGVPRTMFLSVSDRKIEVICHMVGILHLAFEQWRPRIWRDSIIPERVTVPAGRQKILAKVMYHVIRIEPGTKVRKERHCSPPRYLAKFENLLALR